MWATYIRLLREDAEETQRAMAQRVGNNQTTVGRWESGATPAPKMGPLAALAQEYGRNVLEAFVVAGILTEREAGAALPDEAREMIARVRREERRRRDADQVERLKRKPRGPAVERKTSPPDAVADQTRKDARTVAISRKAMRKRRDKE